MPESSIKSLSAFSSSTIAVRSYRRLEPSFNSFILTYYVSGFWQPTDLVLLFVFLYSGSCSNLKLLAVLGGADESVEDYSSLREVHLYVFENCSL